MIQFLPLFVTQSNLYIKLNGWSRLIQTTRMVHASKAVKNKKLSPKKESLFKTRRSNFTMFSRTKLFSASLALGILATAGATGLAQQPQNPSQGQAPGVNGQQRPFGRGEGRGFRHGPGPGGAFGPGVLRELNLTDGQKQQIRAILEQS